MGFRGGGIEEAGGEEVTPRSGEVILEASTLNVPLPL